MSSWAARQAGSPAAAPSCSWSSHGSSSPSLSAAPGTMDDLTSRGLPRSSWAFAARRAWHGFVRHRGIDSAAALSFFASLAIFPAALAIVSAFALGNGDAATQVVLDILGEVVQPETVE